ncbi:MAG: hypothetical protein PHC29_06800 [Candidatus Omnitrophica bacterium]|nr:hypothetical protein [Candidatus Omnitrophota bacterium]
MGQNICCSVLNQRVDTLKVRVKNFRNPCFFYRKCQEEFNIINMVPEGVCPDLFFGIYPQYLSLLYGGKSKTKGQLVLSCPGTKGKTFWVIKARKLFFWPLVNLADGLFRFIGRPKDLFDSCVEIELLRVEGICPAGYSGKVKFSFNQYSHLWGRRYFCPAVFYTLYPFLISNNKQDGLLLQCPADYTSITFEIAEKG